MNWSSGVAEGCNDIRNSPFAGQLGCDLAQGNFVQVPTLDLEQLRNDVRIPEKQRLFCFSE